MSSVFRTNGTASGSFLGTGAYGEVTLRALFPAKWNRSASRFLVRRQLLYQRDLFMIRQSKRAQIIFARAQPAVSARRDLFPPDRRRRRRRLH